VPEGIDQSRLEHAYEALADYHNSGVVEDMPRFEPAMFAEYNVSAYDDQWLLFSSPGGFTNQSFLVSGDMVYEFPGWETAAGAVKEAQLLKDQGATRRTFSRPDDDDDDDDFDDDEEDDDV